MCGFALLGDCSSEVGGLLDAVAGNIVRRVKVWMNLNHCCAYLYAGQSAYFADSHFLARMTDLLKYCLGCEMSTQMNIILTAGFIILQARHLNAVSQLDLSAQLLWAFAELQHVTVATPELLNALGGEV